MPASKAPEAMKAPPTRVTPARKAKRKHEDADIEGPARKLPKTSEEDDLTRDHLAAFRKDICATGKGDDWSEAHQKLLNYLKERRATVEAASKNNTLDTDTGSPKVEQGDAGVAHTDRTLNQRYVEALLCRLERFLGRHYQQHLENMKSEPSAASAKSRHGVHYAWIDVIEQKLAQIKEVIPPVVSKTRTRQVARPSRLGCNSKCWYSGSFLPSESGGMSTRESKQHQEEDKQESKQDNKEDNKEDSEEVQRRSRKYHNSSRSQAPPRAVTGTKNRRNWTEGGRSPDGAGETKDWSLLCDGD